jgi:hypothetical protein
MRVALRMHGRVERQSSRVRWRNTDPRPAAGRVTVQPKREMYVMFRAILQYKVAPTEVDVFNIYDDGIMQKA